MHSSKPVLVAIAQPVVCAALVCLLRDQGLAVLSVTPREKDIDAALRRLGSPCVFLGAFDGERAMILARRLATITEYPSNPAIVLVAPGECTVLQCAAAPRRFRDPALAELLVLLATPGA